MWRNCLRLLCVRSRAPPAYGCRTQQRRSPLTATGRGPDRGGLDVRRCIVIGRRGCGGPVFLRAALEVCSTRMQDPCQWRKKQRRFVLLRGTLVGSLFLDGAEGNDRACIIRGVSLRCTVLLLCVSMHANGTRDSFRNWMFECALLERSRTMQMHQPHVAMCSGDIPLSARVLSRTLVVFVGVIRGAAIAIHPNQVFPTDRIFTCSRMSHVGQVTGMDADAQSGTAAGSPGAARDRPPAAIPIGPADCGRRGGKGELVRLCQWAPDVEWTSRTTTPGLCNGLRGVPGA